VEEREQGRQGGLEGGGFMVVGVGGTGGREGFEMGASLAGGSCDVVESHWDRGERGGTRKGASILDRKSIGQTGFENLSGDVTLAR
jgi:hypothetical protein